MSTLQIIIAGLTILIALMSLLVLFPLRRPTTPVWWAIKMIPTVFAPFMFVASAFFFVTGMMISSPVITMIGFYCTIVFCVHILKVTSEPEYYVGFEQAFGHEWQKLITRDKYYLQSRLGFKLPKGPEPVLTQNVVFNVIPETNRELLCDIWQPAPGEPRSGLAFIYLHGSAWCVLDKDVGTRPFFRHLVKHGHVIMDVAYRLFPETDMVGMVHDAKRAIAWMKRHAYEYNVNPDRIVIGGGSAGGHLSLLAAYTEHDNLLTPDGLTVEDTRVRAVISFYGPTDIEMLYYHTGQHRNHNGTSTSHQSGFPNWVKKSLGTNFHRFGFDKQMPPGQLALMFGAGPDKIRDTYLDLSPVSYVHSGCPPTFLIQGEHDIITSAKATRLFCDRLQEENVPVVMHILPQIDHAFDLFFPRFNTAAHSAYYDVERFLALMCNDEAFFVKRREEAALEEQHSDGSFIHL